MSDFLCFNTDRRDHVGLYGVAFYDVETTGRQKDMADRLRPGDQCVVATPSPDGKTVDFGWFRFLHSTEIPDPGKPGTKMRVLFGTHERSQSLPTQDATTTPPYSKFFKKGGGFKRGLAVMKG